MRIHDDNYTDPLNVSGLESRFYMGSLGAGDALVLAPRRHVARQMNEFREPAQRRFRGRVWLYAGGAGGDDAAAGGKVQVPGVDGTGRLKLTRAALEAVRREEGWRRGWSRRWQNDVLAGRNAVSLRRRCGGSLGSWWSRCGAELRVYQTFSPPP